MGACIGIATQGHEAAVSGNGRWAQSSEQEAAHGVVSRRLATGRTELATVMVGHGLAVRIWIKNFLLRVCGDIMMADVDMQERISPGDPSIIHHKILGTRDRRLHTSKPDDARYVTVLADQIPCSIP